MLTESQAIAVDFFDSGMSLHTYALMYEGVMDNGAVKDLLINAVQAAANAGLDVAAAGVPLDTIVDLILAVNETNNIIQGVSAPVSALAIGGKDIAVQLKALSLKEGPDVLFRRVRTVIQAFVKSLKATGVNVQDALNELSQKMQQMVANSAEAVGDWIAALVPDVPGIDILVANAIKALSENSYDILSKAFSSLPEGIREFFYNPKKLEDMLNTVIAGLIKHFKSTDPVDIDKEVEDEKERSVLKRAAGAAFDTAVKIVSIQTGGFAVKKATEAFKKVMGPKLAEFLERQVKPKIPQAVKMMQTIVPLTFAVVAAFQIIVTEFGAVAKESIHRVNRLIAEYISLANNENDNLDGKCLTTTASLGSRRRPPTRRSVGPTAR